MSDDIVAESTKHEGVVQVKNISDKGGEWALEFRDIPFLDIYIIDKSGRFD